MLDFSNITGVPAMNITEPQTCGMQYVSPETIIYILFMITVLFVSVTGNVLVIIAATMSPTLKGRVTTYFICSLACSDFLYSVFLIPFRITLWLHDSQFCHSLATCYFYLIADVFVNTASILNLLFLSLDRYIALTRTFRYSEILTRQRGKKIIALVWVFSLLFALMGIFKVNEEQNLISEIKIHQVCVNENRIFYMIATIGVYMFPLSLMTVSYVQIFFIVMSHIKAIESLEVHPSVCSMSPEVTPNCRKVKSRKKRREIKTTKSIAIVYATFVICWLPSCIINLILFFDEKLLFNVRLHSETEFLFIYYAFVEVLPILNAALNPFIYSFCNKQFNNAFKRVWRRILKKEDKEIPARRNTQTSKISIASLFSSLSSFNRKPRTVTQLTATSEKSEMLEAKERCASICIDYSNNNDNR